MTANFTDTEERILNFASREPDREFSVQQVADAVNIGFHAAQSIVARFEDMELLKRIRMGPEHVFKYEPTANGLSLRKTIEMQTHSDLVHQRRVRRLKREQRYHATRKA